MTSKYDDDTKTPLSSVVENTSGQPFNEWIVSYDGTVEGWWGEGYIVHTIEPFLVFKWGFTTEAENSAMSGGACIDDGDTYLSVLLVNHCLGENSSFQDIDEYRGEAVMAAIEELQLLNEKIES